MMMVACWYYFLCDLSTVPPPPRPPSTGGIWGTRFCEYMEEANFSDWQNDGKQKAFSSTTNGEAMFAKATSTTTR